MKKRLSVLFLSILIFPALGIWLYDFSAGRVWLSSHTILSRVSAEFEHGLEQTLILHRAAIQKDAPLDEIYGDYIYVFDALPERSLGFYRYNFKIEMEDLKPLRILAGDVNGDGVPELSVTVYKTTLFDPVMAKRPFFYKYTEGKIYPLWLGSKLSRPFERYELWDGGGGAHKLLAAEYMRDGSMTLALYEWDDFGFVCIARSDNYSELNLLPQDSAGEILVYSNGELLKLAQKGEKIE